MSELNVYHHELRHNEYAEFYLKYEVDRHIAELQSANQLEIDKWYNKLMYHKYKRCLAMARWCRIQQRTLFYEYRKKAMWWNKWCKRWLELAEKFKEVSK